MCSVFSEWKWIFKMVNLVDKSDIVFRLWNKVDELNESRDERFEFDV